MIKEYSLHRRCLGTTLWIKCRHAVVIAFFFVLADFFTDIRRCGQLFNDSGSGIQFGQGDVLIEQGADDSRIFILLTGEAEVVKDNEPITVISKSGEVFGELAIISDERRSATVRAKTELLCLVIDQKFLSEIKPEGQNASYYAAFYGFLCKVLAERLKRTKPT